MDRERLDEIAELIVDTVCSNRQTIRIAGDDYPAEVVKARFLKLDSGHVQYVMDCMAENTTYVRNIKKYLLAALYNAPTPPSAAIILPWCNTICTETGKGGGVKYRRK
jgi:hypothetical protein